MTHSLKPSWDSWVLGSKGIYQPKSLEAAFRRTELQSQKDGVWDWASAARNGRIFFWEGIFRKVTKNTIQVFLFFFLGSFPTFFRIFLVFLTSSRHNFCACRVRCGSYGSILQRFLCSDTVPIEANGLGFVSAMNKQHLGSWLPFVPRSHGIRIIFQILNLRELYLHNLDQKVTKSFGKAKKT